MDIFNFCESLDISSKVCKIFLRQVDDRIALNEDFELPYGEVVLQVNDGE